MKTIQTIVTILLFSLTLAHTRPHRPNLPHHDDPCLRAYDECAWEFHGYRGKIPVFPVHTPADKSFTPAIISKDRHEKIGILNTNNVVPEFIMERFAVPISKYGFTPTHFKPFPIDHVMASGVGHQTFQHGQKYIAKGQCVRVFFTHYQLLTKSYPPMVENIHVYREDYKCVVFRFH